MYKTEGRIDRQFYNRIGKYFYTPKSRVIRAIYVLFALVFAVLAFIRGIYAIAILVLVCAAIICLEAYITKKRYVKDLFKMLKESSGIDAVEYLVDLDDDGVAISNKISGGTNKFDYSGFVKMAMTDAEILLFTKSWQMIPIFKTELNEAEQGELLEFLKGKCSGIKKW